MNLLVITVHYCSLCIFYFYFFALAIGVTFIDFRQRFIQLLNQGGVRPLPSVIERLQSIRETAIITSGTSDEAIRWYEWAKVIPRSFTREKFREKTGFQLDGMHPTVEGLLVAATDSGAPHMFKIVPSESKEVYYASLMKGGPFLVCCEYQEITIFSEAEDENSRVFSGLLMRKYDGSLLGHEFQLCEDALLARAKAMILAVNYIHGKGIVHADIKESNIFLSNGDWFIGDFGSCCSHGDPIEYPTPGMYPVEDLRGHRAKWHHDWFMLAVVFAQQLNVRGHPIQFEVKTFAQNIIAAVNSANGELKDILTEMVSYEDQFMSFYNQDSFPVIIDKVS